MGNLTRTMLPNSIQEDGRGINLAYKSADLNYIYREQFNDDYGVYQRRYNLFRHLEVNKKGMFNITTVQGDPLLVQSYKSCHTSPLGGTHYGQRRMNGGCPVYIKQQQCNDAWLLGDCYRDYIEWRNGNIEESSLFSQVMNLHRSEIMANSKLGLRGTQFVGQLYDPAKIDAEGLWAEGVTEETKDRFRRTTGACRGVLPMAADMAQQGHSYMHDQQTIDDLTTKFDIENCRFNGDIEEWMQQLIKRFPAKLRKAAVSGRARSGGVVYIAVSEPLYPIFQQAVLDEQKSMVTNGLCWREDIVTTADGGSEAVITYRNRIVIVPDTWTCICLLYTSPSPRDRG